MAKIDEQDILNKLQNPQTRRRAFEEIVNVYSRQLYWQIHYILQNHDDTDDVLQNTFIKAWKGIERFKGESAMYTWLYRIAHNEAITFLKQKKQMSSIDDEDFTEQASFVADDYFDGDATQEILMQAVSTLPTKQRQVFCLKYFEDKKYEEISELVGTSIGALKASYHIAVEKITNFIKTKE
ncbi:MAG: RNA polymerase sigma factor [Bacteroidales bacterium]|nr:RNA polymerase sigma factor [Bacteroidales bacterium]